MSQYLRRLKPEDVHFLLDFSEFKEFVEEMLGDAKKLVTLEIDHDEIKDAYDVTIIRPMVILREISTLTEEDRHKILDTGFSIDREPFDNGDFAMEEIFGTNYTILSSIEDDDGAFFTIEMPYRDYVQMK
ncbi:hypothetical protein MUN89_18605 [Halobacillus salinarum]|uniref:Uncharacterized protein n=1 Tax=Halobacillus salinarum TaxID=2932257 RepID=A0ABY4EJ33_9BACI|nr:hypothetical protein [Halobacillus salinarum]UOQ43863.1 hypothetical protein MUN89_18605 [Halobacillus salinarum]